MRQRNPGPGPLIVPAIPAEVPPGGEVDYPVPLAGFELVDDAAVSESPATPASTTPPPAPTGEGKTPVTEEVPPAVATDQAKTKEK